MADVVRLRTKAERASQADAVAAMDTVMSLLPPSPARAQTLKALQRVAHPVEDDGQEWAEGGFVKIGQKVIAETWDAIEALPGSARPHKVRRAFDMVLLNLDWDTGRLKLSREELADKLKIRVENVSRVMGTLEELGVINRDYEKTEGVRGRGRVFWEVNPHVAWRGSQVAHKEALVDVERPRLRLVSIT